MLILCDLDFVFQILNPGSMKSRRKFLFIVAVSILVLILGGMVATYISIDSSVREFIRLAKDKYPGNSAEDALISYLLDSKNSTMDRSRIAVWTLGQIQSQKALPILRELYNDDPEGKTCKGRHNTVLCQYELFKAIHAIEMSHWPLHSRLNK
jgi:hypothetical protein